MRLPDSLVEKLAATAVDQATKSAYLASASPSRPALAFAGLRSVEFEVTRNAGRLKTRRATVTLDGKPPD
jgi:hypothetical protein